MRKKYFLLLLLLTAAGHSFGQAGAPVNLLKDRQDFEGYTIRLLPARDGTYGYDILKGKELIIHQSGNPFILSPRGLSHKEDVFKVARWQISNLNGTGQKASASLQRTVLADQERKPALQPQRKFDQPSIHQPSFNQPLPRSLAAELQIKLHP